MNCETELVGVIVVKRGLPKALHYCVHVKIGLGWVDHRGAGLGWRLGYTTVPDPDSELVRLRRVPHPFETGIMFPESNTVDRAVASRPPISTHMDALT